MQEFTMTIGQFLTALFFLLLVIDPLNRNPVLPLSLHVGPAPVAQRCFACTWNLFHSVLSAVTV